MKNFKIYLDERFPIIKNGIFVLIFTLSSYIYSKIVIWENFLSKSMFIVEEEKKLNIETLEIFYIILIFIIIFLFFFQIRICDEIKDYEEDLKYRSYRPVQRGIISLKVLKIIGFCSMILQILLAYIFFNNDLLILISIVWIYLFLMTKEFFLKNYIIKRKIIYALSHIFIMILINIVILGGVFIVTNKINLYLLLNRFFTFKKLLVKKEIFSFLVVSYLNGLVLEIGRKLRREDEEENGVETYSKLWGKEKAVKILLFLFIIQYFLISFGLIFAFRKYFMLFGYFFLAVILIISFYYCKKFLNQNLSGKIVENISGIWIVSTYLNFGLIQFFIFNLWYK